MLSRINGNFIVTPNNVGTVNAPTTSTNFSDIYKSKLQTPKSMDEIFEKAADTYGVPLDLLKAIGKAESDFRPNLVSSSGAQGVMQLMPGTAKELGVTDPFDPEMNIMGGAKYIKTMIDRYDGDIKLALAAYNAGSGNVAKYGGIPPFKETQNYVQKVMKYAGGEETIGEIGKTVYVNQNNNDSIYNNSYSNSSTSYSYSDIMRAILSFQNYSTEDYSSFMQQFQMQMQPSFEFNGSWGLTKEYCENNIFNQKMQIMY